MLHRTHRSVVAVLSILVTLAIGSPWMPTPSRADPDDITLRFDQVESYARAESPRMSIITQEVAAIEAATDAALGWSNPSLGYDHEQFDAFREWQITLSKRFETPFAQSSLRGGRDARIRSAGHWADQQSRQLFAELKSGYVRLRFLEDYLDHLDRLSEQVNLISTVAGRRYAEGELSGVELNLVQLAAYSVDATRRRIRQQYRMQASVWRAEMGLESGIAVRLSTSIGYEPVRLEDAGAYATLLATHPATLAQLSRAESLQAWSKATGPSLVPGVDLYAGFKRFGEAFDGFVAGVALDLPVFDRNAGRSRELAAERVIVENELALSLARSREEIATLVTLIEESQPSLDQFSRRMESPTPLADSLMLSYREGSLTLDALLGAIQIESAALQNYYDELAAYYLNLFRLEAITGASIVHFAS